MKKLEWSKNNTFFKEPIASKADAMSDLYETSINIRFSFKVSLKVKEEVSMFK